MKNKRPIWKENEEMRRLRLEATDGIKFRSKVFSKGEDLKDHRLQRRKHKKMLNWNYYDEED